MSTLLELRGITKRYPGVTALDKVSMRFEQGGIHALVGENGAGKSTLIKIISGAIAPSEGSIVFDGVEYTRMTPAISTTSGIGVIYQEFNLVPSISVAENVFLGQKIGGKCMPDFKTMRRKATELFRELGIDLNVNLMVRDLSVAKRQLVEIAKAMVRDAKLLIMDEPSAAIAQAEVENMLKLVLRLKERGVTILYISHRMNEIFQISDTVTVLRDGKFIDAKPIDQVERKDLINLMVGRELSESFPPRQVTLGEPVLEVEHLTGNGDFDISFTLHKGEILGVAGLVGAGRTEMARVIFGTAAMQAGSLRIKGKPIRIRSPRQAINSGIGLIPEDRKAEGGYMEYSILWNVSVMSLPKLSRLSVIRRRQETELSRKYADRLRIKTPSYEQLLKNLSGGNQQKVILAKVLAAETDIIIFDEPTRGIDVGAKQEIYHLMNELVEQGVSILMISSEMEELMGMSDRIMVMCEGRCTGFVEKEQFDQSHILELASQS